MRSRFTPVWKYFHVLNKWTLSLIPNTKSCVKDLISYRIVHGDFTSWACCARHHVVGIVNCHGIVIEIIPQGQIDRYFTHALQTLIVKKISRCWDRLKFGSSNNHERCDYLPRSDVICIQLTVMLHYSRLYLSSALCTALRSALDTDTGMSQMRAWHRDNGDNKTDTLPLSGHYQYTACPFHKHYGVSLKITPPLWENYDHLQIF